MTLQNLDDKIAILRNKLKLRKEENSEYIKPIFITPDYMTIEKLRNKRLRDQLKEINKYGNRYMIKNGVIVRKRS